MRHRETAVDVVVVLIAMTAILSIFDDTFADRSYLVAGLVPVVVLLLLTLVARRFHEGGWWYFLSALVLFSPLGALAALREPGPFLVPTTDTLTRVLVESVSAPTTLVSTVPPVDPSGQVMLVPFLIGFLATTAAAWLALGTTRPLAPVVPLVLALVATIPLGVLVPSLLVPRGIIVGLLLLAWAAIRARRREPLAGDPRGSVPAALTAVVTVAIVSGLAGVVVPDTDQSDRKLFRGQDNTSLVSDAAGSVMPAQARSDEKLLKVSGLPEGRRLRFAALDLYDGAGWVPAEESPGSDGYGTYKRIGEEVAPLRSGTTVVVRVQMRPGYSSDWLPMLGELTSIDLDWNPGRTEVSDIRYNQATSSALVLGGVDARDTYSFESVVGDVAFSRRDPTREPSDDQRQPLGAFMDPLLRPFDREELLPLERVLLLARYLRANGTVRLVDDFDQSSTTLARRMLGSRGITGSPFQYTALMALGASRLGVAARMVTGAEPGRRGVVDYGDVTTWVELQFADGSWRPLDLQRYLGTRVARDGQELPSALDPRDFVEDQLDNAARGRDQEIRLPEGTNPDGTLVDPPASPWRVLAGAVALGSGVALLALLLIPVIKTLRRRRRRSAGGWSGVYVNGWQEVLDAARDRGTPVLEAWSRVAQARQLGVGLDLARRADAAVFAPRQSDPDDGRAFWEECLGLRGELLAQADARRRWWAPFNPASLLAGWARRRGGEPSEVVQVRHEDRGPRRQQPAGA